MFDKILAVYKPGILFERTVEHKRDMFKSWARDDESFFAAGACHILADLFVQLHGHEGFKFVYIKPNGGLPGNHVYASDGRWAFDHGGWTKEAELLETTERAYAQRYPGWTYTKIIIEPTIHSLEHFCKQNNHRLPWQYPHLPWERAYRYINTFADSPPTEA